MLQESDSSRYECMSFLIYIDRAGDVHAPDVEYGVVAPGQTIVISGWLADPENARVARKVTGLVDGFFPVEATVVSRPDIAKHFGHDALERCGFAFEIPSKACGIGEHEFTFRFFDEAGEVYDAKPLPIRVVAYTGGLASRILVAAAPKSGSTYTSMILQKYFELDEPHVAGMHWQWEHNLDANVVDRLRGRSYVLQRHMRPYAPNLAAIRNERISVVVTWRNLADTIVSLDDHVRREGVAQHFLMYSVDAAYLAMPDQRRYQFLIRYAAPWYVSFYLGWKEQGIPIARYELLASDPLAYFTETIATIAGSVDRARLSAVLDSNAMSGRTRGNVGTNGRALEAFSQETRDLLEDLLRAHFVPLDELIGELPWHSATV